MNLGVGAIKDMRDAVTGVTFNAIYAIGGYSGKAILGTAEKYEIQTDTWSEIAPMKTPRRNVGKRSEGGREEEGWGGLCACMGPVEAVCIMCMD